MEDKTIARRIRYAYIPVLHIGFAAAVLIALGSAAGCTSTAVRDTGQPIAQATGHVARSHSTGILMRPVSSLFRLLFVTTNTVTTTVKPAYRRDVEALPIPDVSRGPGMDLAAWEDYLDRKTRKATRGTMRTLVDGEAFFSRLHEAIGEARESITLRMFIFDNDDFAVDVGTRLRQRASAGVETRVLLDGFATIYSTINDHEDTPRDFEAPSSVRRFLEEDSSLDVRQSHNPWFTGDHVKTVIVDGHTAFMGGMNIAREYRYEWHDLMIELQGPVVNVLQHEFNKAWAHAGFFGDLGWLTAALRPVPDVAGDGGYPVRVLYTRTENAEIYRMQREAIRRSQHYIFVQNPYFTDDVMLYELARARKRGVDVRVIVPLATDVGQITRNNVLAANALLRNGVRVYIYPGMSHVKAAIYDGWASVGSANWDRWSFYLNKELNVATSEPSFVDELKERVFEADFAASVELTEPIPERWTDYLYETFGDYFF